MRQLRRTDFEVGKPLLFSIFDVDGRMLLRRGTVINMPDQLDEMIARGAQFREENVQAHGRSRLDAKEFQETPFKRFNQLSLNLTHMFSTILKSPEKIDVQARIIKISQTIQELNQENSDSILAAAYLDLHTPPLIQHQMMGGLLTEIIGLGLGLEREQRRSLVCAALTRDLGQALLQPELDKYQGQLPESLLKMVHQHPDKSIELLKQAGVNDPIWFKALQQHHERLDGSGYPAGLKAEQLLIGTRILAVADTYSAMIKPRSFRAAYSPQTTLKAIYLKKDMLFDDKVVRILISKIGLLPPGSIVKLSCGEIAVVKSFIEKDTNTVVYTIYGKTGTLLMEPVARSTAKAGYAISGLVPHEECRSASIIMQQVWDKK